MSVSSSITLTSSMSGSEPWTMAYSWRFPLCKTVSVSARPMSARIARAAKAPQSVRRIEESTTSAAMQDPSRSCLRKPLNLNQLRRAPRMQCFFAGGPMALRPLRNATISFGLVSIPVRFYTATKSEDVHFNLLHASCGTRVTRKWWCPNNEKIVDSDELIRGYAISKNKYVTFADEEIEALETDNSRALDITEFVDLAEVDPIFFEKAYFLGPAPGGRKTYKLLATAMKKQNKVAVARWVAAGKEHLVVIRPYEKGLALHTMYYADEVRDFEAIDLDEAPVREKEIQLAETLINELTEKTFNPMRSEERRVGK